MEFLHAKIGLIVASAACLPENVADMPSIAWRFHWAIIV
ncbi:hypothetical protein ASAP_1662 [Asaia bogorensis]|uniref:Uncharacterized protein n=1 Tax=Asaia bogorensis TaxID=91915 RepID=A0A060QKS9_9PROT|nr:hypothetical protein ASAP_1662 [Asaia bogorensis]